MVFTSEFCWFATKVLHKDRLTAMGKEGTLICDGILNQQVCYLNNNCPMFFKTIFCLGLLDWDKY